MVDTKLNQRTTRALVSVPPPFVWSKLQAPVIRKITLCHHQLTQTSLVEDLSDLPTPAEPTGTMPHGQDDSRITAAPVYRQGLPHRMRDGLVHIDVFAPLHSLQDGPFMGIVGGCNDHPLNFRIL